MRNLLSAVIVLLVFSFPAFAVSNASDIPLGQSATADDLFETQRGYFHPSLSLSGIYTDNLFNTKNNTEDEFITVLTPGLWLAFPGQLKPAEPIFTDTTAAGGLQLGRFGERDERPFQAFLNYEAAIKRHSNFDNEDITTHKLHALARGTTAGGLSLEANEVFNRSYDAYATGVTTGQSRFDSNLIQLSGRVPVGERFGLRLDYHNFIVDYDAAANSFRDRTDNKLAAYFYYAWSQKTKFFVQYSYLDIEYDTEISLDNSQQRAYLGIDYKVTEKVRALGKLGYNSKDNSGSLGDRDDFVYELQADYQFTPKNNLNLQLWRKLKESDTAGTTGILGSWFAATFSQKLGQRMVASAMAGWARDDYDGTITVGSKTDERQDDYLMVTLSLSYAMQKWFEINAGYNYVNRDSSFSSFNYDSNGLFVSLTGKL